MGRPWGVIGQVLLYILFGLIVASAIGTAVLKEPFLLAPNEAITRIQAARIISNALAEVPGYDFKPADFSAFVDADQVPSRASGTVAQGVLSGSPGGTLAPNNPLTRAEAYTLFLRLLRELGW